MKEMTAEFEIAYCKLDDAVNLTKETLMQTEHLLLRVQKSLRRLSAAQQAAGEEYLFSRKQG